MLLEEALRYALDRLELEPQPHRARLMLPSR
jgi:hypothetical protein